MRILSIGGQAHTPQRPGPRPQPSRYPIPGPGASAFLELLGWLGRGTVTSSRAKKVRWSQRQTVLRTPTSVEQPLEDQSPDDPGEKEREHSRGEGRKREERVPERKGRGDGPAVGGEGPPGPTFSCIPEFTAEAHVLKPESGSQGRGRGDWARGEEIWGSRECSVSQHVPALGGSRAQPVVTQEPHLKHLMYPRSARGVWTGVGGRGVCLGAPLGKCTCEQMCKAVCACVGLLDPLGPSWEHVSGTCWEARGHACIG